MTFDEWWEEENFNKMIFDTMPVEELKTRLKNTCQLAWDAGIASITIIAVDENKEIHNDHSRI